MSKKFPYVNEGGGKGKTRKGEVENALEISLLINYYFKQQLIASHFDTRFLVTFEVSETWALIGCVCKNFSIYANLEY